MPHNATVAVVASLNMDHVVTTPRIPAPGETILGSTVARALGGKGGNQSVAAARLGAPVAVLGCVGDDQDGRDYVAALTAEGIDVSAIGVSRAAATGMAAITVATDGANSIVVVPGANAQIQAGEAAAAIAALPALRVVVGQAEASVEATRAAFQTAREHGIVTLLNPAPANDFARELLPLADVVAPNEVEFEQLTGARAFTVDGAVDEESLARGAASLLAQGAVWVIVTLGSQGSVAINAEGLTQIPARPVRAVDTTAAGDSYIGTVAAALAGALPDTTAEGPLSAPRIVRACHLAASASAHTVTVAGAQPSLPLPQELAAQA